MADILGELRQLLGAEAVLDAAAAAGRASSYWDPAPLRARALVRPRNTDEISRVMQLCHARGQPVVVHGGLTGVCEGDRAGDDVVVLSLERMTLIEEIDVAGRTATVQAGCPLQKLQEAATASGLYFPLDLGARGSCTLGGNVATNAGGTNVIRYGMIRSLVLGLEAVLPDGTVITSMNRMLKNNAGYDLKQLFIGSEGTLGIVTRVVVALKEASRSLNTVLCALDDCGRLVRLLKEADRQLGGTMGSFEVMWADYYAAVTAPGWHASPMSRGHALYAIIEAAGPDEQDDAQRFHRTVESLLKQGLIVDAVLAKSMAERQRIWAIREDFEALRQQHPLFLYDVSLPIRDMLGYVEEVRNGLRALWPDSRCYTMGHVGDGNLHFFVCPGAVPGATDVLHHQSDEIVYQPLRRLGGSVSAEHGIGLAKKPWLPLSRSDAELALMKTLKRALDPRHILNPGKIFDR